jgi:non-specific serine/threonine protein kinase
MVVILGGGFPHVGSYLIEGVKLSDALERERLPLDRVYSIAIEVVEGLRSAHENGIVHRDLKPSNIMLGSDGHAKIIDFGLAKLVEPLAGPASEAETSLKGETRSGQILGTVFYMSPEQARGDTVDARSGLFSLGAMLYEMACGAKPFDGKTSAAVFDAILNREPLRPR